MSMYFSMNQRINISGQQYTVNGMIWFKEKEDEWQEYKLIDTYSEEKWLTVEQDDNGRDRYYLFQKASFQSNGRAKEVYDDEGRHYTLHEEGTAVVIRSFGDVDVDLYERCHYREFREVSGRYYLSFETWDDDLEKSKGYLLRDDQIEVEFASNGKGEDPYNPYQSSNGSANYNGYQDKRQSTYGNVSNGLRYSEHKMGKFLSTFIILIVLGSFFGRFAFDRINVASIEKYLKKNPDYFTYVTSVTSNQSSKKAKVYRSNLSVNETVQMIIKYSDIDIEKVSSKDETDKEKEEDGVGLQSSREYAFVYTTEEDYTAVQVSSLSYMEEAESNAYHSRYRNRYYHRMWRSTYVNSFYNDIARETRRARDIRRSSSRSRNTMGGGTSYGK